MPDQLHDDARQALRETIEASEAAELVGVSEWKIYDLARRHLLPHVRIGRRVLFRRQSLLQWLADQEAASVRQEPAPGRVRSLKKERWIRHDAR